MAGGSVGSCGVEEEQTPHGLGAGSHVQQHPAHVGMFDYRGLGTGLSIVSSALSSFCGEVRRLLLRRGLDLSDVEVTARDTIDVGGTERRAIHFHRFRSRGREAQPDAAGTLLDVVLPEPLPGPLAIGYGSHFGLGVFVAVDTSEVCGSRLE